MGPTSDGVPWVTQCPLVQGGREVHRFRAGQIHGDFNALPGTYWYHSHVKKHRAYGLQGGLVIKDKDPPPQYRGVVDVPGSQTIMVQEWYHEAEGRQAHAVPQSILVNGKTRLDPGRTFRYQEQEAIKFFKGLGGESSPQLRGIRRLSTERVLTYKLSTKSSQ